MKQKARPYTPVVNMSLVHGDLRTRDKHLAVNIIFTKERPWNTRSSLPHNLQGQFNPFPSPQPALQLAQEDQAQNQIGLL